MDVVILSGDTNIVGKKKKVIKLDFLLLSICTLIAVGTEWSLQVIRNYYFPHQRWFYLLFIFMTWPVWSIHQDVHITTPPCFSWVNWGETGGQRRHGGRRIKDHLSLSGVESRYLNKNTLGAAAILMGMRDHTEVNLCYYQSMPIR